jgi:hypothetical protein
VLLYIDMFHRLLALPARRPAMARTFARRARRGRNNNNNNNESRAVMRGENYEEPSASARTSILYRAVGGLGACVAVSGYLYFVYNPGQGERRYGQQRAENDEYFEGDAYRDGDWDHLGRSAGGAGGGADDGDTGGDGGGFAGNDDYFEGRGGTRDPYERNDQGWDANGDGRTSSEARSRSTWA